MTSLVYRARLKAAARGRTGGGHGEVPLAWAMTALVLFAVFSIAVSLVSVIHGNTDVLRPMTETVDVP
ncbi:MAG TPA: hypothetical protein VMB81_31840 [Candidatus Sulfotelmatobacter sp.]|nr:hypothetical protein [Candidatus Sulfotelmatobacter sp.]